MGRIFELSIDFKILSIYTKIISLYYGKIHQKLVKIPSIRFHIGI